MTAQMNQEGVPPSQLRTGGSGTEYPEIRLIHPEIYEGIKERARKNLAGLPNITVEVYKELADILGL